MFSAGDARRIEKGLTTAERVHRGQVRGDGSPYIVHPVRTALLALQYESGCAADIVIACLLHDALEDTSLREADVATEFGDVVARYVVAVTRYRAAGETPHERYAGKIAKWRQIMKADQEVRVIKTFDYCDNVISWKFIRPEMPAYKKIPRWLREAQEMYLPLARITNEHAARLMQSEVEYYLAIGHEFGDWLQG
jgi:GTP pyrophosphokinase